MVLFAVVVIVVDAAYVVTVVGRVAQRKAFLLCTQRPRVRISALLSF